MMTALLRPILLALPIFALVACEQAPENAAPAGARAEGEVLGGSISDEMIPLDQLRSQSPPLRVQPATGSGQVSSDDDGGTEPQGAPPETGSETPAADTAEPAADEG
ncbi:MAG: hypothetical protein B7X57_02645 [Erythrobacter sp. 34-65-8]|nr:MAG: hypothetical protein B7X57_02645 [Erythrobacter sp. 34-65-8]